MKKSRFIRNGKQLGHGDVTGGFNSSSLDYTMTRARDAFLNCIQCIQSGKDPKPYLLTIYALSLVGDYQVRDKIIADFEEGMQELDMTNPEGRYSPEGIINCIAAWAAIAEYLGMLGADKKITVLGESSTLDDDAIYTADSGEESNSENPNKSLDSDEIEESIDKFDAGV